MDLRHIDSLAIDNLFNNLLSDDNWRNNLILADLYFTRLSCNVRNTFLYLYKAV